MATDDEVVERLKASLASGDLPETACEHAEHLIHRLSRPVRVSVLGLPGSGKSSLINMFLQRPLIPEGVGLPTTEFSWGEKEAMTLTTADGDVIREDKVDFSLVDDTEAALLQVSLPNETLKKTSLMEVVADGDPDEMAAAVEWTEKRTEIALWCSQSFGDIEQLVWQDVPDSLKDHAFLVLTKADILATQNVLASQIASLETIVAEEFHSMFAVASLQALRAVGKNGIDKERFRASGGASLVREVVQHADRGRRADLDSAEMFLLRYQENRAAPPVSRPVSKTKRPVSRITDPMPHVASRTLSKTRPVSDLAQEYETALKKKNAAAAAAAPKVKNPELFMDCARFLKRRGDGLAEAIEKLAEGETKSLIDQCVSAVDHMTDLMSQDETDCDAVDAFIDELAEAQDMMVLMQVEDGDAPAADAVTLLLQLRRELEMQVAA